jgi:uncharacterized protein
MVPNALVHERSLYLRQHRLNPVDWMPWGEPAFARARELNRPVLLSIGYSACHWCHVMARESFEDDETAALMNDWFVNIKVDREERPDVDAIHIRALQAMGRRAGWPLTIFLTPDGKPFWGGTYFPPEERSDLPAFRDVLRWVKNAYDNDRDRVAEKAAWLVDELAGARSKSAVGLTLSTGSAAAGELLAQMDPVHGGLRGAPKFPYPSLFRFLWNQGTRERRSDFQHAVLRTLDAMAAGGLFDHVGGGFFRYAVDEHWRVPHFEKMLYDNAQLLSLYAEAYRCTGRPQYRLVVKRTADWLIREMRIAGGAFTCSLDAESDGKEGAYYLLTAQDVDGALGAEADRFKREYLDSSADFPGGKILDRSDARPTEEELARFADNCDRLIPIRSGKTQPRRDDKVLSDWNGLAIIGLAEASTVLEEPGWLGAACEAFDFVARESAVGGILRHAWNDGETGEAAILDDHANMALAALKLHEMTGEAKYLTQAIEWVEYCVDHFRDPRGAYYFTPEDARLVARICDGKDSATPSGNGTLAQALVRLHYLTGEPRYSERASALFDAFAGEIEESRFLLASILDGRQLMANATQITVVGDLPDPLTRQLISCAHKHGPVDRVVSHVARGTTLPTHHPASGKTSVDLPTAFICVGTTCSLPLSNRDALRQLLEN